MAKHARLVAPLAPPREEWPWHTVKADAIPVRLLSKGDRRFEADGFLSSGLGLKVAITSKSVGWKPLGVIASIKQPPRTKAVLVPSGEGKPFLQAGQMFDIRPHVRKWLAEEYLPHAESLYAPEGTIIVRRSADVGRMTLTLKHHEGHLISDHFFRVDPNEQSQRGWIYAFLRSRPTKEMMTGAQYGHIIKHIEISHLSEIPVPEVDAATAADFDQRVQRLLALRNQSYRQTLEAERLFAEALGPLKAKDYGEDGFAVRASQFLGGRRRFDASFSSPLVSGIWRHFKRSGKGFTSLKKAGYEVWVPGRYKRNPAADGVRYFDSSDLLEVAPDNTKQFAECGFGDKHQGRVKKDWLLMPSSGQVYGIIGSVVMVGAGFEDGAVSNHVIRIAPAGKDLKPGYVLTALSHPDFGRPLIKALAFGSSVPEIDDEAVRNFKVVRLGAVTESAIADLAEASAAARAEADVLERELSADAGRVIAAFISGDTLKPMRPVPSHREQHSRPVTSLAEHGRVRLLKGKPEDHLRAGATGTVVHVYAGGKGLEVEFDADSKSSRVVTLNRKAVEPLAD